MIDKEMLYPLATAVEMIPMPSAASLYQFLSKHPEIPRLYRRSSIGVGSHPAGFEQAFLTGAQILQIRAMQFHPREESRYAKRETRVGSTLRHIYDRAMA